MVFELHIWGPAFSLPSIEAQCLATVAYFVLAVPKDAWVLIPSSDPSLSPTIELPVLRHGTTWVSRFRNIVDYLRQYSNGDWDLDQPFKGMQKADRISFSTFIESKGELLVDLSLYVSSQNYHQCTSPAYGTILQWPNQWIIPPKLHKAARLRTQHLGLSSLDSEAIGQQGNREQLTTVATGQIPRNPIQGPQDTVATQLCKGSQSQFKLEALTTEFFEPLRDLLGSKMYFLSDRCISSLDCLALGYLSLALVPELPYPWLRDSLQRKAPNLAEYVERMCGRCFGLALLTDVFDANQSVSLLPLRPSRRITISEIGSTLFASFVDSMPILGGIRINTRLQEAARSPDSGLSGEESKAVSEFAKARKLDTYLSIATVAGGVVAFVGYMFHEGLVRVTSESLKEMQGGDDLHLQMNPVNDSLPDDG